MAMSEANKQKARERMQAMHAAKKAQAQTVQPQEDVEALKARIAELEGKQTVEAPKTELTVDEQIINGYQKGHGTIQDLARWHNVGVDHVLQLIGEGKLSSISVGGDMIDPDEAGPEAVMNYGKQYKIPYKAD